MVRSLLPTSLTLPTTTTTTTATTTTLTTTSTTPTTTTTTTTTTTEEFDPIGDTIYIKSSETMTHSQAIAYCSRLGMEFATMPSSYLNPLGYEHVSFKFLSCLMLVLDAYKHNKRC